MGHLLVISLSRQGLRRANPSLHAARTPLEMLFASVRGCPKGEQAASRSAPGFGTARGRACRYLPVRCFLLDALNC